MKQKTERVGQIQVRTADGRTETVDEYCDFLEERNLDGSMHREKGLASYRCKGARCNLQDDGSFVVVSTGQVLTRA